MADYKEKSSVVKIGLILLGSLLFFGFIFQQIYKNLFVYSEGRPTRHDLRWLAQAEDGQAHAQYLLGTFRVTGRQGLPPDLSEARRWFEAAAAQNYAPAKFRLGELYRKGKGVKQDLAQAAHLIGQAAEQGDVPAMNALGELYARGEGVPRDPVKALRYYRLAAKAGFAPAERNLGYAAAEGEGMAQDYGIAFSWYMKAAKQGDGLAMSNLGLMHEHGQGGAQDLLRAWDCFYHAALLGYTGAQAHRERVALALPTEWRALGLYERDGRDCLSGVNRNLMPPVSRVRD